jgi:putative ABC transport system substrate-binding protein
MYLTTRRRFLHDIACFTAIVPGITSVSSLFKWQIPHVGYLNGAGLADHDMAFTDELQKLGFTEGQNIIIEKRLARPNTPDAITFAKELAGMDLALIFVSALPFAIEVRKANPEMPMVIGTCPGMISNGFAKSLEHPGGIYTGIDELPPGVTSKRLQLLKAFAPTVNRVGLLSTTPGHGGHEIQFSEAEKSGAELGIEVKAYRAKSLQELEKALDSLVTDGMNGMLNFQGGLSLGNRKLIIDIVTKHQIPAIYQATLFAEAGGLISWAPDLVQQFREAAKYVNKILKGAKPGDLAIDHPPNYHLTVNLSAAKKIGLSFTPALLSQATKVLP